LKRWLRFACLTVCICLGSGGFAAGQVAIDVNPKLPSDIAGGATKATLQQAAAFAWQEFIALNWPAMAGQRDVADTSQKFGANAGGFFGARLRNPLVWETFRAKVEIFNVTQDAAGGYAPPGYSATAQDLGYNTPLSDSPPSPSYSYLGSSVPACPDPEQAAPASPAWINLDETTEIALAQMFAGGPAIQDSANSLPQLIRYAVKANHVEYEYIADPGNQYFNHQNVTTPAKNNITAYTASPPVPVPPGQTFISFPTGTVEIKSAWRPLNNYDQPTRFHVQTVRFYENKGGPNHNLPCYFEQQWGLIALHIIQKTPTAPAFIYATFEQADNIRQPNATPVEDPDGNVTQPIPGAAPTTPELAYQDSPTTPKVIKVMSAGEPFCTPQNNLYFKDNPNDPGLTGGGAICVNQRYEPIPPDVIMVNNAAHQAITAYNIANGVADSPWLFYKLVSVQASPFDVSAKSPTDPVHSPAVFYQANIVVETNYTLQQFLGRISKSADGAGAPTSLGGLPPPNVVTPAPTPPSVVGVNMGGCMGCHGNAQVSQGTDFSFILAEGVTKKPETPSAIGDAELRAKYLDLFQH
jgi:hypothetical protein